MSLILPKYLKEREDYLYYECDEFKKKLNAFIDENQSLDEPYFVLFKQEFDRHNANLAREVLSLYLKRPPFIKGSMVFFVDNSRGLAFHLWTVKKTGSIKFNLDAARQLKGILRVSDG